MKRIHRAGALVVVVALLLAGCRDQAAQQQTSGNLTVTMTTEPTPPLAGQPASMLLQVRQSGVPLDGAQVSLTPVMPGMPHPDDPGAGAARALGHGHYAASLTFVMDGRWNVAVVVTVPHGSSWTVTFPITVEQP